MDPGGKHIDVLVQSVGPEAIEDLGTEGVKVDGVSLVRPGTNFSPELIDGPEAAEELGIEEPLIRRERKVKIDVQVQIQVGADVIGEIQREIPPRSNSVGLGSTTRQGMGNPDWIQWADTWVGGYN